MLGYLRALRLAQHWARPSTELCEDELELAGPRGPMGVSRIRPAGARSLPSWILLHGVASPGRHHTVLRRLARGIASTGAAVYIPGVDEWAGLELAPHLTQQAIVPTLAAIEAAPECAGPPGLMGFSFGGAQALRVAATAELRGRLSCVVSFGSYHSLGSALDFLFTGVFEHEGQRIELVPDCYGLWIVALNYLREVPGYEDAAPLLDALRELAVFTGDFQLESWDPRTRRKVAQCRARLDPRWLERFDQFVPEAPGPPRMDASEAAQLAAQLAEIGLRRDPLLRFPERMQLELPVFLVHGRSDGLSPFTQTLDMVPHIEAAELSVALTGLVAHSETGLPDKPLRELVKLARVAARVLGQGA